MSEAETAPDPWDHIMTLEAKSYHHLAGLLVVNPRSAMRETVLFEDAADEIQRRQWLDGLAPKFLTNKFRATSKTMIVEAEPGHNDDLFHLIRRKS